MALNNLQMVDMQTNKQTNKVKLTENEKKVKFLELAREMKNWCTPNHHRRIGTGTGGPGNKRTIRHHLSNILIQIGQNTEKSSGDLKRFIVMLNYQQTQVWITLK